jgi:chromate transporter
MKKNWNLYFNLFITTFTLSAFTFGGGYVIVPLMKKKFVDKLKWIEEEEMLNMIAIAQSSPGAIAVNASILIGYRVAGIPGAILSLAGTVLPPLIILTVISFFYQAFKESRMISAILKGMEAGVAAVIVDVVLNLSGSIVKEKQILSILIMIGAFAATFVFGVNVVLVILICGIIGAIRVILKEKQKRSMKS